jgi:hypothetical protein
MIEHANGDQGTTSEEHADGEEISSRSYGRRALMLGAATAGAGAAVSLVAGAEPAGAASPDAGAGKVKLGKANTATATTSISMAVDGDAGVEGIDTSSGGGYGLHGTSENGTGVYGTSKNGNGIYGGSTDGSGVYANSTNGSAVYATSGGFNAAVYADAAGEGGSGVYGTSGGENGLGIYGNATGQGSVGVAGYAYGMDSYGVYAYSENSESLYVDGSAQVTGTLSKGGGSFKIDHPVDPEGKYLYHSFVESPDMKNVYDGTVTLDGNGRATVELPDWFEALNRDFRYTLTALDEPAPDLHISSRVKDAKFSIAGGKADQEVSWQVTGIRQDAWANANRIPVEVDKKAEDQGRYLHPELFGGEAITALAKARDHGHRQHLKNPSASRYDARL